MEAITRMSMLPTPKVIEETSFANVVTEQLPEYPTKIKLSGKMIEIDIPRSEDRPSTQGNEGNERT